MYKGLKQLLEDDPSLTEKITYDEFVANKSGLNMCKGNDISFIKVWEYYQKGMGYIMDKEELMKSIDEGIEMTDMKDEYSVGMRNGMRWCKSLIDGKEPEYDKCSVKEKKVDWLRKLTSRKLWVSVCGFVSMVILASGGTENDAAQVTAVIMAGATVVAYVLGEGLTDSAHVEISEGISMEAEIEDEG